MPNKNFTVQNLASKDKVKICFKVNSAECRLEVPATYTLLDILR